MGGTRGALCSQGFAPCCCGFALNYQGKGKKTSGEYKVGGGGGEGGYYSVTVLVRATKTCTLIL